VSTNPWLAVVAVFVGGILTASNPCVLARIVFIDKEKACDCTRKRVEQTWTALQSALGTPPALPVQPLHVDTQAAEAATYTSAKPLMVPPGIYFVDRQGAVVGMLQGEIESEEIEMALKGR
jgi:hypothetical protein